MLLLTVNLYIISIYPCIQINNSNHNKNNNSQELKPLHKTDDNFTPFKFTWSLELPEVGID